MPHQCTECGRTFADGSKEMLSGCPDCGGNKFQFTPASQVDDAGSSGSAESAGTGRTAESSRARDDGPGSAGDSGSAGAADADDGRTEWPTHGDEPEAAERSKPVSPTEADNYARNTSTAEADGTRGERSDSRSSASDSTAPDESTESDAVQERETTEFVESNAAGAEEDTAQASARSDVVSPDELSVASRNSGAGSDESTGAPPETDRAADANASPDADPGGEPTHERPELDDLREELNDQFESIRIVSPGKYELNLMELYDRQEYIISLQEDGRYVIEMPNSIEATDE